MARAATRDELTDTAIAQVLGVGAAGCAPTAARSAAPPGPAPAPQLDDRRELCPHRAEQLGRQHRRARTGRRRQDAYGRRFEVTWHSPDGSAGHRLSIPMNPIARSGVFDHRESEAG